MSSQKNNEKSALPNYPRAPINDYDNVLMQRPPPPSYEESQGARQPENFHQQQQYQPCYAYASQPVYGVPGPQTHYQAVYQQTYTMNQQTPPVLTLAKGAEIRTNSNGVVSIPPPPPGCAPTPAQWAAMQGQQVLVKEQKKRSFFS